MSVWRPNPDFLLGGRTSASAECRHWSARAVRWSSCAILLARFSRLTNGCSWNAVSASPSADVPSHTSGAFFILGRRWDGNQERDVPFSFFQVRREAG